MSESSESSSVKNSNSIGAIGESSSKFQAKSETDLIQVIKANCIEIKEIREKFSIQLSNRAQSLLERRVRIHGIPERQGEAIRPMLLHWFAVELQLVLPLYEIVECYRTACSLKKRPRPIVVKFGSDYVMDMVLKHRDYMTNPKCFIVEELCEDRVEILHEATRKFGKGRVYIAKGAVLVKFRNDKLLPFFSLVQFENFLEGSDFDQEQFQVDEENDHRNRHIYIDFSN